LEIQLKPSILLILILFAGSLSACTATRNVGQEPSAMPSQPTQTGGIIQSPLESTPNPSVQSTLPPLMDETSPRPEDANLEKATVYVDTIELITLETYPVQYRLHITGSTPTPCHKVRASFGIPDENNAVQVEIYSVAKPNTICAQMLAPFDVSVAINGLAAGKYTLYHGSTRIGEISLP
jgi:hypothetical protein